jgi:hypothetical protein
LHGNGNKRSGVKRALLVTLNDGLGFNGISSKAIKRVDLSSGGAANGT